MYCHILKDKKTGEEYLIPGCYSVINWWHLEGMTDRQIIKEFCSCIRPRREKYVTKSRDEVFAEIEKLKTNIQKVETELEKMKEFLSGLESEVFLLNTEEVL